MATVPLQEETHYCSDPNCQYCQDLKIATEQLRGECNLQSQGPEPPITSGRFDRLNQPRTSQF